MAYLQLQSTADYNVHENFQVDMSDYEDHTFNGIMFDVGIRTVLPVEYVEIHRIWVRGMLGKLSVYVCEGPHEGYHDDRSHWTRVFSGTKRPSEHTLVPLDLDPAPRVPAGSRFGIYVHSAMQGDAGIVYDNKRNETSHEDDLIQVFPGAAHISCRPFSNRGMWGYGWRPDREFVGRLSHGVRYLMWRPDNEIHSKFPRKYQRAAKELTLCAMRKGCVLHWVPLEITFYILNMCPWNWFGDLDESERPKAAEAVFDQDNHGWHSGYRARIERHMLSSRKVQAQIQRFNNRGDTSDDSDDEIIISSGEDDESDEESDEEDDEDFVLAHSESDDDDDDDDNDDDDDDGDDNDDDDDDDDDDVDMMDSVQQHQEVNSNEKVELA